jgi:ABC-type phosphate transport system substrate-binding protein
MSNVKLLLGATALVSAAVGLTGAANATVTSQVYGGGSSLVGPYLRQAEDCYGNPTPLVIKGSTLNNPTYANPPVAFFNYMGTPPQNCATNHVDPSFQLNYISTGSGTGLKGLFTHNASAYWGDTVPPGGNMTAYPSVDYANAETAMLPADVTAYNSGGSDPATGLTFGGAGNPAVPYPLFGHLIQIPLLITPVDIAYDSVYKKKRISKTGIKSYHFNVQNARSSGGLVLDAATYCAIFNGQITDWNQIPVALNGGVSLQDPTDTGTFSVPLVMVGRSDSSGTTSVFTRHLAAQCPSVISGALITEFNSSISAAAPTIYNASWNKANPNFGSASGVTDVPGKYIGASGSDGVADYVEFDPNNVPGTAVGSTVVQGRMGYVGPDFVLPYVTETGNNTFGLDSASLVRAGQPVSSAIAPTGATAKLAFGSNIKPPANKTTASDPTNWVQSPLHTAPIAIPANIKAYPIVGTSNLLTYTCFADATVTTKWVAFLNWFETSKTVTDPTHGLLAVAGFAPMPPTWQTAIKNDFIAPTTTTKAYNLFITQAGTGPASGAGSQCHAITPGA